MPCRSFYTLYQSVNTEARILAGETDPAAGAARIANTLPLWKHTAAEGAVLVDDLLALSGVQPKH